MPFEEACSREEFLRVCPVVSFREFELSTESVVHTIVPTDRRAGTRIRIVEQELFFAGGTLVNPAGNSSVSSSIDVQVIMACHNRRDLTIRALQRAAAAAKRARLPLSVSLFDDGSTDGTSEAVESLGLDVAIIPGDGRAFWAKGMSIAEEHVLRNPERARGSLIVWLNDDVVLDDGAFVALLEGARRHPGAVLVGATRDPVTGGLTYSGLRRAGLHPLSFEMVSPTGEYQSVDTFNGNFVAVPTQIAQELGGIDGGFSHAFADIDYGLRCQRQGVSVLLMPGTRGMCARNLPSSRGHAHADWRAFVGIKGGGNTGSLRRILRKSNPHSWVVIIGATYAKWWIGRAFQLRPGNNGVTR